MLWLVSNNRLCPICNFYFSYLRLCGSTPFQWTRITKTSVEFFLSFSLVSIVCMLFCPLCSIACRNLSTCYSDVTADITIFFHIIWTIECVCLNLLSSTNTSFLKVKINFVIISRICYFIYVCSTCLRGKKDSHTSLVNPPQLFSKKNSLLFGSQRPTLTSISSSEACDSEFSAGIGNTSPLVASPVFELVVKSTSETLFSGYIIIFLLSMHLLYCWESWIQLFIPAGLVNLGLMVDQQQRPWSQNSIYLCSKCPRA